MSTVTVEIYINLLSVTKISCQMIYANILDIPEKISYGIAIIKLLLEQILLSIKLNESMLAEERSKIYTKSNE